MRVMFCGSGSFAVPTFEAVVASRHELVGVITQPARPAGRGGKLRRTSVAEAAQREGLKALECPDINSTDVVDAVRAAAADVICVADFGQMIRSEVREAAGLGAFNLHASLLPELRGAAPVNWAIVRGYDRTGVTTFSLVDKMDAGDIYLQAEALIAADETAEDLRARLADMGAGLVIQTLDLLESGRAEPRTQDHSAATFAPMLRKSDGLIDFAADAVTVRNLIHGTWPWPGGRAVFSRADGTSFNVVIARAEVEPRRAGAAYSQPGVLDADLCVATGDGRLKILEIKPADRKLMSWRDFVNGYRVGVGDRCSRVAR